MAGDFQDAGVEPALEDLLADPLVQLLLERDGVEMTDLRGFLTAVRTRLQPTESTARAARPEAA